MIRLAWLPEPTRKFLLLQRRRWRMFAQPRALRALASARTRRIVIGSSGTRLPGWIETDQEVIDLLDQSSWARYFEPDSLDAILAEHVWEHLSEEQAETAAKMCLRFLKPGGHLRVAVPDGLHPSPVYIAAVKPPADDHKVLYDYRSFRDLFCRVGFDVRLNEYFDEHGQFQFNPWDPDDGMIRRSKRFDRRNAGVLHGHTSVILDAIKPAIA